MQKAYLLMLLVMSVAIPVRMASQPTLRAAERGTWRAFLVFLVLWALGVRYIYWRLPSD